MRFGLFIMIFLGLIFGSFASVLLSRRGEATSLKQASSILRGRSECPRCKHRLQPWDLIPILSFLLQRGKCRYCHKKISRLYPILESGSALIFVGAFLFLGQDASLMQTAFVSGFGWILWLLLVYDVLRYEVHIPLLLLGAGLGVFAMMLGILPWGALRGGVSFLIFFLLMYFLARRMVQRKYGVKEEGLGLGDVLLAPFLGVLLYGALPSNLLLVDQILIFLLFLTLSGAIGILWYLVQNKLLAHKASFLPKEMADQGVPFLPAMILAVALIVMFQKRFLALFLV